MKPIADSDRRSLARRAALLAVFWLGFWILAAGMVVGLLGIPIAQLHYRNDVDLSGFLAACAGLTLAYSLRPRRAVKADVVPTPLLRGDMPRLFDFIDAVAARAGVHAPVEIHLVTAATAFISAERSWTGKVRTLSVGLGLPLFAWLSEAELGAVLAHEFGHFTGGDVSLAPWVYRTRVSIGATIHALDDSVFFLDAPFRGYGNWFLRLSGTVSRAQEYAADAFGAAHFGARASGDALTKIHLLAPLWSAYFDRDVLPALQGGARVPVFEGFRRFCAASPKRRDVCDAIERAEGHAPSPFDTHPSLDERLAALGRPTAVCPPPLAAGGGLFEGTACVEALWYKRVDGEERRSVGWDELGDAVLRARILARFDGTEMAPERLPLTRLPDIARSLDEWWQRLKPDGVNLLSPQGQHRYVLDVLRDWIIAGLCHAGYGLRVRPGTDLVLERDGVVVDPAALLARACEGRVAAGEIDGILA